MRDYRCARMLRTHPWLSTYLTMKAKFMPLCVLGTSILEYYMTVIQCVRANPRGTSTRKKKRTQLYHVVAPVLLKRK